MEDHAVGRCYIPQKWLNQSKIQPQEFAATTNREQLAAIVARLIKRMEEHAKSSPFGCRSASFSQSLGNPVGCTNLYRDWPGGSFLEALTLGIIEFLHQRSKSLLTC